MKSKWQLKLISIGRGHITKTIIIEADSLPDAEQKAIRECKKHLVSKDVALVDHTNLTYGVATGYRINGKVEILSL